MNVLGLVLFSTAFVAVNADAGCPQIFCFMSCPYGYQTDASGCLNCNCKLPVREVQPVCDNMRCLLPCPGGYQLDDDNCMTCTCGPEGTVKPSVQGVAAANPACAPMRCLLPCEGGYESDANGCPTCTCLGSQVGQTFKAPPSVKIETLGIGSKTVDKPAVYSKLSASLKAISQGKS